MDHYFAGADPGFCPGGHGDQIFQPKYLENLNIEKERQSEYCNLSIEWLSTPFIVNLTLT